MRKCLLIVGLMFFVDSVSAAGVEGAQVNTVLKQQVKDLLQRVKQLESGQSTGSVQPPMDTGQHSSTPRKKTGLQWEVGGYAKLDVVYSSISAGENSLADEFIINGLIPTKNTIGEDDQLKFTARESRLWFKSSLPTAKGQMKTYIEGDFFGAKPVSSETLNNNADFRLRQAFGEFETLMHGNFL